MAKKKPVRKKRTRIQKTKQAACRYVLLPPRGITSSATVAAASVEPFLTSLHAAKTSTVTSNVKMRVVDQIVQNGAKLVEMTEAAVL